MCLVERNVSKAVILDLVQASKLGHPRDCHATRRCDGAQDLLGHKLHSALMHHLAQRLPLLSRLSVLPRNPRPLQSQGCQTPVGTWTILTHAPCPPLPVSVCTVFRGDVCPQFLLHALAQWIPVGWGTSSPNPSPCRLLVVLCFTTGRRDVEPKPVAKLLDPRFPLQPVGPPH
jgi:hypothetical protein